MAFEVSVTGDSGEEKIILKEFFTGTQAEIYSFGALLNCFAVLQNGELKNAVYGFKNSQDAQANIAPMFQSAKLNPFVCRLRDGNYTFENEKYHIEKYYLKKDAIHGLLYDARYTIQEKGATELYAYVTLAHEYRMTDKGFPFLYKAEIIYKLESNNRLSVTTVVTNLGNKNMPVSDGWHPYFHLGESINTLQLQFRSMHIAEFDARLLPTGNFEPYAFFNSPQILGINKFDNCFVLDDDFAQPACILKDEDAGLQLNIMPDKSYPYLQIYTPESRKCIAIENLSSLPDAFNNTIGLRILKSGESAVFTTAYQLINLNLIPNSSLRVEKGMF